MNPSFASACKPRLLPTLMLIMALAGCAMNAREKAEHDAEQIAERIVEQKAKQKERAEERAEQIAEQKAEKLAALKTREEAAQTAREKAAPSPCLHTLPLNEEWIAGTARVMQRAVCESAFWLDGLFGDQRARQRKAARGAHGQAELGVGYSEFNGVKYRVRFDVKIDLTNINERLSAFAGRDTQDNLVRDTEVATLRSRFPRFDDREETIAGLGYALPDNYRIKTDFRAGVRFSGLNTPRLFAQMRFAANVYADEHNLVDLRATPFVNTRDGLGLTLRSDYNHVLSQTRLIRWNNTGTRTQNSAGVDWRSALTLYQRLPHKRAIAYEIFVRGLTAAPEPLAEYGVQASYRQPVLQDRLFVAPVVGYSWPRVDPALEREGSYAVAVVLELPFGDH